MEPISLADLAQHPWVKIRTRQSLHIDLDLPIVGEINALDLTIEGPKDADKDGFPEFHVNLDIGGNDVFEESVELDPKLLRDSAGGAFDATLGVFQMVIRGLKAKGLPVPLDL